VRRVVTLVGSVACLLAGTCTLGVVRLERAVEAGFPTAERVALIDLGPAADAWARAAIGAGLTPERVAATGPGGLLDAGFAAWVLPVGSDLSVADTEALEAFTAAGGGLLLVGAGAPPGEQGAPGLLSRLGRMFPGYRFEVHAPSPQPAGPRASRRDVLLAGLEPGERYRPFGEGIRMALPQRNLDLL